MSEDQFKDFYARGITAYNRHDLDEFFKVFSPTYVHHRPSQPEEMTLEQYKQDQAAVHTAFPDFQVILDEVVTQDTLKAGKFVLRYHAKGTGKGTWRGIPVEGKTIEFLGFWAMTVADGLVVEGWELLDSFTILTQLGVIPAIPAMTAA